jgi:protein TonB
MQKIDHAIVMARRSGLTPQRATGLVFVGLVHVAAIWALVVGLHVKLLPQQEAPLIGTVIKTKPPVVVTPPATPHWVNPTETTIAPPPIDYGDGQTRQTITQVYNPQPNVPGDRAAMAISGTHTIPPYPPLALRLGEQGGVRLHLTISADGEVTQASIVRSSGYGDLDQMAQAWVMAHWRYQGAIRGGAAVPSTAYAEVVFDLKNVR